MESKDEGAAGGTEPIPGLVIKVALLEGFPTRKDVANNIVEDLEHQDTAVRSCHACNSGSSC